MEERTDSTDASPKQACWQVQLIASVNPLAGLLDAETVAEDEISAGYRIASGIELEHFAFVIWHDLAFLIGHFLDLISW
jgi:hypothetical protein